MKFVEVSVSLPGSSRTLGPWTLEGPQDIPWLILGPSGSGKTTFLKVLAGRISFRGHLEGGLPAQQTAFLPQFPERVLCGRNIAEDLGNTLAPDVALRRKLRGFLKACGLEVPLHRDSRSLSGGEKRRLLLAVVAAAGWRHWGLDEPEAGLDVLGRQNLMEWIRGNAGGRQWIATSAPWMYLTLNPYCVVLRQGQVFFAGSRDEALAREDVWNLLGFSAHPAGKAWKDIGKQVHNLDKNVWKKLSFDARPIAQVQGVLRDSEVRC